MLITAVPFMGECPLLYICIYETRRVVAATLISDQERTCSDLITSSPPNHLCLVKSQTASLNGACDNTASECLSVAPVR